MHFLQKLFHVTTKKAVCIKHQERCVCMCLCVFLKPWSIQLSPALLLDWKKSPSRILIIIVKYLFFEFLVLFLGSLYYATSALNFKCDKQSMSVGGRWLMTGSDRAFKPALFSGKRYFHVNLLCVLQRWDKSPAHNSGKVETTSSGAGPWLDSFRGERREGSERLSSSESRDQAVTLHYVRWRKMNQPWASQPDTRATVYCKQILFMKTDLSQRQKTGAINSVCQSLKSGFCKINLIVHFISYWKYYNQQKSLRNIQSKIKWNLIHREKWPTQTHKPWGLSAFSSHIEFICHRDTQIKYNFYSKTESSKEAMWSWAERTVFYFGEAAGVLCELSVPLNFYSWKACYMYKMSKEWN